MTKNHRIGRDLLRSCSALALWAGMAGGALAGSGVQGQLDTVTIDSHGGPAGLEGLSNILDNLAPVTGTNSTAYSNTFSLINSEAGNVVADPFSLIIAGSQYGGLWRLITIDNSGAGDGVNDVLTQSTNSDDVVAFSNFVFTYGVTLTNTAAPGEVTTGDTSLSLGLVQTGGFRNVFDLDNSGAAGGVSDVSTDFVNGGRVSAVAASVVTLSLATTNTASLDIDTAASSMEQDVSQTSGFINQARIDNSSAGGPLSDISSSFSNIGRSLSSNANIAQQLMTQTNDSSDGGISTGSSRQSLGSLQIAGGWNDLTIDNHGAAGGISNVETLIANAGTDVIGGSNTSVWTQSGTIANDAAGAIGSGPVVQQADDVQVAGVESLVRIDNSGAAGGIDFLDTVFATTSQVQANNNTVFTQVDTLSNTSSGAVSSGPVRQSQSSTQTAGQTNDLSIDNSNAAGGIDNVTAFFDNASAIVGDSVTVGTQASSSFNTAGGDIDLERIEASSATDQFSGLVNRMSVDGHGASEGISSLFALMGNTGLVDAGNVYVTTEMTSNKNVGQGDITTGGIGQTEAANQVAGVRNEFHVTNGGTSTPQGKGIELQAVNIGTVTARNLIVTTQSVTIANTQASGEPHDIVAGSLDQQLSVQQVSGVQNEARIANDGGVNSTGAGIAAVFVNGGAVSVSNETVATQLEVAQNSAMGSVTGGDTSQAMTIDQFAGIRNDIGIDNSGHVTAAEDGISSVIMNSAAVTVRNNVVTSQNNTQENEAGGNAAGGNVSQQTDVTQFAGVRNQITTSNSGSVSAGNDGIVAVIGNSGTLTAVNTFVGSQNASQSNTAVDGDAVPGESSTEITHDQGGGYRSQIDISNTGNVHAGGTGIVAVIEGDDTGGQITISNSGTVVSQSGAAIVYLGGDTRILNLAAPAFIGGTMDLGGEAEVNIRTGKSHSVAWTFDGTLAGGAPNVSGPLPSFYNAGSKTFATIDPTGFSAAFGSLANVTGMVSRSISRRVESGDVSTVPGKVAFAAPAGTATAQAGSDHAPGASVAVPTADAPVVDDGSGAWVAVTGGNADQDGTGLAFGTDSNAISAMAGYDRRFGDGGRIGLVGGYVAAKTTADSQLVQSYDMESRGFFGGIYGRQTIGGAFLDYALTGGGLANSDRRFVNDNLAHLGQAHADADYNSYWLSPELALGTVISLPHSAELIPSVRARYAGQWIDGYKESGSSANAKVDSRQIGVGEGSVELAARQWLYFGSITARIGVLGRTQLGDDSVGVTMIGDAQTIPFFTESYAAGYAGLDVNMRPTDSMRLDLAADVTYGDALTSYQATAQLGIDF